MHRVFALFGGLLLWISWLPATGQSIPRDRLFPLPIRWDSLSLSNRLTFLSLPVSGVLPFEQVFQRHRWLSTPTRDSLLWEVSAAHTPETHLIDDSQQNRTGDTFTLKRRGSISRGIITGNRQDLTVESGLRLELEGQLTEEISVKAALTDENTPIQPDGTTRRLNDLDRVFIQLKAPFGQATLGDFDFEIRSFRFGVLRRKLQGVSIETNTIPVHAAFSGKARVAGAVSRGIYHAHTITPIEGVQGPYRLRGASGEPFIIIVAGSERVYLDGELLERGRDHDYIIDYATAEITFTDRRIIAAEHRIYVEFEYVTSLYSRRLIASEMEITTRMNTRVGVAFLQEADGGLITSQEAFSPEDLRLIRQAGDSTLFKSSAVKVPYTPEAPYVLYTQQDTVYAGRLYRIYVPVTAAVDSAYRVQFTYVGDGRGEYQRGSSALNGIVYRWVGPLNGAYAPVQSLPVPQRKQLLSVTTQLNPVSPLEISGEWSLSDFDRNTLSPLHDQDNRDVAYQWKIHLKPITLWTVKHHSLNIGARIQQEYIGARFSAFERIRPVEYVREWNLTRRERTTERIDAIQVDMQWGAWVTGSMAAKRLNQRGGFRASHVQGLVTITPATDWKLRMQSIHISSENRTTRTSGKWLRQSATFISPLLQIKTNLENRKTLNEAIPDSLFSYRFVEILPSLFLYRKNDSKLTIEGKYRKESRIHRQDMRPYFQIVQAGVRFQRTETVYQVDLSTYWRRKRFFPQVVDPLLSQIDENLGIHLKAGLTATRHFSARFTYDGQTERTPILQEVYVRTGEEMGQYIWVDTNQDNIQQVDEFFPETTPFEGTYVRLYVPSDRLFPIVHIQSTGQIKFKPTFLKILPERKLETISFNTRIRLRERNQSRRKWQLFSLQQQYFRTPHLTLSGSLSLEQSMRFNQTISRLDIQASFQHQESLNRLSSGLEERSANLLSLNLRYRLSTHLKITTQIKSSLKRSYSEAFSSRNYTLRELYLAPGLQVFLGGQNQIYITPSIARKHSVPQAPLVTESVWFTRIPIRISMQLKKGWLTHVLLEGTYATTKQKSLTPLLYELTEGRGAGLSALWNFQLYRQLNRYLRFTLQYNGRKPESGPIIHSLQMKLNAVF